MGDNKGQKRDVSPAVFVVLALVAVALAMIISAVLNPDIPATRSKITELKIVDNRVPISVEQCGLDDDDVRLILISGQWQLDDQVTQAECVGLLNLLKGYYKEKMSECCDLSRDGHTSGFSNKFGPF